MLRLTDIVLPLATFELSIPHLVLSRHVTAISGPSGSGKTSLLELIAGLRKPKNGAIMLLDRTLRDPERGIDLRPQQRAIGYVPQDLALFPHLSVEKNIYYGGHGGPDIGAEKVFEALQIEPLLKRRVTEISGGEQQRVALARALLSAPKLLLLDEPLGSLDPELKAKVLPYLCRVRDEFEIPMLYVTHDQNEAAHIAQELILIERGRVIAQRAMT